MWRDPNSKVSITPEPASAPKFPQKERPDNVRNMSDNREPMVGQVPRPAGVSPMKNNQEQGQRRSNPGRGQLESTRRSIKNALYTMRDVMQDDDMAENMQNSFQVSTTLDYYTQVPHIVHFK